MKEEIKKQWVKALRSGKYKQARGVLARGFEKNRRFCCLGVLCDLHAKATGEEFICEDSDLYGKKTMTYFGEYEGLPGRVRKWAGIPQGRGSTVNILNYEYKNGETGIESLADLNDSSQMNFKQIADVIEKYL